MTPGLILIAPASLFAAAVLIRVVTARLETRAVARASARSMGPRAAESDEAHGDVVQMPVGWTDAYPMLVPFRDPVRVPIGSTPEALREGFHGGEVHRG